jgi:GR25 family glycosyltransferase involved in LPS biosynthesis
LVAVDAPGVSMYQGFYINLDRAVERRHLLELQLEQAGLADRYCRFPAIDGQQITYGPDAVPGSAALGCTLSHLSVLKSQLGSEKHLHILEDDAVLHRDIARVFEAFLCQEHLPDWDVLMTDLFVPPDVYLFKLLHQKYKESAETGAISFMDIGTWDFAGASSYFVNKGSKEKFLQMMEHSFGIEAPYDLRIRSLAKNKMLKVYACFPFFSTISESSTASTIAGDFQHVLPLSEYRRSFYVEPDLESIKKNLSGHERPEPDLHMQIYLSLIESLIDPRSISF